MASGERLARLIFTPIHVDLATGDVLPDAFSDVERHGLSVQRMLEPEEAIHARGFAKAEADRARGKVDRAYLGYVDSDCAQIRGHSSPREKTFCVVDTGLNGNTLHADVVHTIGDMQKSKIRELKHDLWRLFSQLISRPAPK